MQKNNIALQYRIQEKAMPIQTQRRVQLTDQKRIMRKQYKFSDGWLWDIEPTWCERALGWPQSETPWYEVLATAAEAC